MQQLSFIHVSDLHLDNFPPVKKENDEMAMRLHEAPYEALKNLLELCRQKSPQFIVFSGDIHEHGPLSLKARFSLIKFFNALKALNIPFYYACGNHDHIGQNDSFFQNFDRVFRFSDTWSYFPYSPQNSSENMETAESDTKNPPLCRIYGISHNTRKELKNLLKDFSYEEKTPFTLGVLHASVHSCEKIKNTDKHVVALCKEKDFEPYPLDYWALGHIHEPTIIQENPMLVYAGAMQATRMNENGEHGAYFVTLEKEENQKQAKVTTEFFPLAPLETYTLSLPLPPLQGEELENTEQCLEYFLYNFKKEYTKLAKNPLCSTRIFTLFLEGQHDLSEELHDEDFIQTLKTKLESLELGTQIFIHTIKCFIRPCFGYENASKRDDLLGEVFRVIEELRRHPDDFEEILKKIENDFKIKNDIDLGFFMHSDKPSQEQLEKYQKALLNACENICVNILEPK